MKIDSKKLKKIACILLDVSEDNIVDIYCFDREKYIIQYTHNIGSRVCFNTITLQLKECSFYHIC